MATKKEKKAIKVFDGVNPTKMNIRIIFITELLGSCPNDPEIYSKFIADKATDKNKATEIADLGVDKAIAEGTTKFLNVKGRPALSNHAWLGYIKEKVGFLKGDQQDSASSEMTSYKKKIDLGLSYLGKYSILVPPKGETTGILQRPLRASTAAGERVALASSVTVPPRTRTRFTLVMTNESFKTPITEALNMGCYFSGTGQWRGSGKKGRFMWEELDDDGNIIGGNTEALLGVTTADPSFNQALSDYLENMEVPVIEEEFE